MAGLGGFLATADNHQAAVAALPSDPSADWCRDLLPEGCRMQPLTVRAVKRTLTPAASAGQADVGSGHFEGGAEEEPEGDEIVVATDDEPDGHDDTACTPVPGQDSDTFFYDDLSVIFCAQPTLDHAPTEKKPSLLPVIPTRPETLSAPDAESDDGICSLPGSEEADDTPVVRTLDTSEIRSALATLERRFEAAKGEWEAGLAPEPLFCFQHIEEIRRHWANSGECWRPFMCKTVLNDPGKHSRGGSIMVQACKNCIKYAMLQGFSSETLQRFS